MADLKSLKLRISGIKNTQKITKAMKMVAAAKLRHARIAAEDSRKSYEHLLKSYENLNSVFKLCSSEELESPYIAKGNNSHLFVLITTDRGLCGGMNSNLTKYTLRKIQELSQKGINAYLAVYGKKSYEQIKAKGFENIIFNKQNCLDKSFSGAEGDEARQEIMSLIEEHNIGNASLIYTKFNSAISQEVTESNLLLMRSDSPSNETEIVRKEIDFEANFQDYLNKFMALKINFQLVQAIKESFACEQGARMTAMDNAVNNCQELVSKLSLIYNRTRQAKITTELIEILAASESI